MGRSESIWFVPHKLRYVVVGFDSDGGMQIPPGGRKIRFGHCTLDDGRGVLIAPNGTETLLRPKTLELLRLLLRNPGRVVARDEILDAVWPGVFVTDDSITQCVVELRKGMGEVGTVLLRTVPRRGYLLQADVMRGTAHLRTPLQRGLDVMASLQGRLTGIALPKFIVDTPGGHGKVVLTPDVIVRREGGKTWLRTWRGAEVAYPDPQKTPQNSGK